MITAYNCVKSRSDKSLKTVYTQQYRYLLNIKRDICPRKAFRYDFKLLLHSLIQDNYSLVVALDANEYMKLGTLARMFCSLGLINSITIIISATPPKSYIRDSNQIDSI